MDNVRHSLIFDAGTPIENGSFTTSRIRAVVLTSVKDNLFDSIQTAAGDAGRIYDDGRCFRTDLGVDIL